MNSLETGLAKMEDWMRMKRHDHKTRRAYARTVRKYHAWLQQQPHLRESSSEAKVEAYLTLRARQECAASTQNVDLSALKMFYERGLLAPLQEIDALRAFRPQTIRRAPSLEEVRAILPLKANGIPVPLPGLLARKYPRAPFAEAWAWVFPAKAPCQFAGKTYRYRMHESAVQRAFKEAVRAAGASDDLSPHHLRHAWATHQSRRPGVNIRDVQKAMGHRQLETTAGYITPEVDRLPDALSLLNV